MKAHIVYYEHDKQPKLFEFGMTRCPHGKTCTSGFSPARPKYVGTNACYACKHCDQIERTFVACCFPKVAPSNISKRRKELRNLKRSHR